MYEVDLSLLVKCSGNMLHYPGPVKSSTPAHSAAALQDAGDFKVRVPLIKLLKTESSEWVSKYARGGSARKESARRMYIAVDALIGHLASNG